MKTAFENAGFVHGTIEGSWEALQSLADQLESGNGIDPEAAKWFVSAVRRSEPGDHHTLVRELGLLRSGRRPVIDSNLVVDKVAELIASTGSSINQACKLVAKEFGISPKTCWYWHTKHKGLAHMGNK